MNPGRALLILVLAAVAACAPAASPAQTGLLTLTLTTGPTCPVEQIPPDPQCATRPVVGREVVILAGDREVARGTSDGGGQIRFQLPIGRYTVHDGLTGTFPTPPADQVVDIGGQPVELALDYDTGIR